VPAVRAPEIGIPQFGLCRICLRELVHAGEVPGVTKASW
jgi:small subunit ribosomal protein S14